MRGRLHKLHWVIQLAMGWTNSHLHQFLIGNDVFVQRVFDEDAELDAQDNRCVCAT